MLFALATLILATAQPPASPAAPDDHKSIPGAPTPDDKPATQPTPAVAAPPAAATPAGPAVPFPHPLITEVLYAVPVGTGGDANRDGKRDAAGDEFIEIINPHDKPIQLFGYTLTDSQDAGKGQMRFTFPACDLAPGAVAVVFNGLNSAFTGPVGDSKTQPPGPSEHFGNAMVFTMKNTNTRIALGNGGDHVLLSAPDRTPIHRVYWSEDGQPQSPAPAPITPAPSAPTAAKPAPLIEDFVPIVQKTSVHRDAPTASGRFVSHMDSEHSPFSPGVYVVARPPAPAVTPAAAPPQQPKP